jgi:hypothetical protein
MLTIRMSERECFTLIAIKPLLDRVYKVSQKRVYPSQWLPYVVRNTMHQFSMLMLKNSDETVIIT